MTTASLIIVTKKPGTVREAIASQALVEPKTADAIRVAKQLLIKAGCAGGDWRRFLAGPRR